ncbi:MAG: hypothetical protein EB100_05225 [Crocinitomicaceae bacterium]|nr:hypothetical protein [Crocinitomicaceae bacterium]
MIISASLLSQHQNFRSKSELGLAAGAMYYIGDLNPTNHFINYKPAFSFFYRYNYTSRVALRGQFLLGSIYGNDASDPSHLGATYVNRNLSFNSDIYEVSADIQFSYLPFQIGHKKYRGTGYLFSGIAYFQMNPYLNYLGDRIELRTLGTEGQNTPLNSEGYYSQNQFALPVGLGFKYGIGSMFSIGMEYGMRFVFTDYLDDVGKNTFVNRDELENYTSPLTVSLSNRNLDKSNYGMRGNESTSDYYFFGGITLSIRLGDPDKCFKH